MQKAKDRCHDCGGRAKVAEYYLKWKSKKNKYKNLSEEEKEIKREYQKKYYDWKEIRKWNNNFLYSMKMSKKPLKFDNIEFDKKGISRF